MLIYVRGFLTVRLSVKLLRESSLRKIISILLRQNAWLTVLIENAVLDKDVIRALGGKAEDLTETNDELNYILPKKTVIKQSKKEYKKLNVHNVCIRDSICNFICDNTMPVLRTLRHNWKNYVAQTISILFIAVAMFNLIPRKKLGKELIQNEKSKRKIWKRTKIATLLILFLIPLTIFIGIYYLGDKKYYFISLLIILETTIFLLGFAFENRKPKARELVIISALCAIGVAGRTAFFMLPQFKPVAAIVIISGVAFGGETRGISCRSNYGICIEFLFRARAVDTMANVFIRNYRFLSGNNVSKRHFTQDKNRYVPVWFCSDICYIRR